MAYDSVSQLNMAKLDRGPTPTQALSRASGLPTTHDSAPDTARLRLSTHSLDISKANVPLRRSQGRAVHIRCHVKLYRSVHNLYTICTLCVYQEKGNTPPTETKCASNDPLKLCCLYGRGLNKDL